jgi:heme A synthase
VPIWLALAHQGMALILLFALVWNASVLRRGPGL